MEVNYQKNFFYIFQIFLEALLEIKKLKDNAVSHEELREVDKKSLYAMQEMVESLTQNKLVDATKLEDLNKQISVKQKSLEELQNQLGTFNEISIENEALKRQLKRLSDENDDLLSQMQAIDSTPECSNTEVKNQIDRLTQELLEAAKHNEEKTRENKSLQSLIDNNSAKIKKIIQENSELKETLESRDDLTSTDQVQTKYEKCIRKLKLYREKICDISEKFKLLKADREILMSTTKEYSESVSKWQKEIANVSIKMIERIRDSNEALKLKNEEIETQKEEISNLKSSKEAVNLSSVSQIRTLEAEIQKLNDVIQAKDKILTQEREAQKKLKQAVKNKSLLDLEMEAYEKTLDELNKKLEAKKLQVTEFENTLKMQIETIQALKSQITSLEASLNSEKSHSADIKKNLDLQLDLLRKTEHERTETTLQLEIMSKNCETLKLENSEIKMETAKHVGETEKRYQVLESERDEILRNISSLENDVDKFKKLSTSHEKEIESLRAEFASYKIRAQGVLRQSQTKDISREQELQDEIITLQKSFENFKEAQSKVSSELESLKKNFLDVTEDKVRLQDRCKDLLEALERQSDEVLEETRKRNQQHDESIKAYQLQIDTLNTFYKKKLQETEKLNAMTISELQTKLKQLEKTSLLAPMQTSASSAYEPNVFQLRHEDQKLNLTMMDREEAEGSEDQSSQSSTFHLQHRRKISKGRELLPLDELLNSSFDDNSNEIHDETISNFSLPSETLEQTRLKLANEENRVQHLTTLLADSEKDLARMQQMNEMLKEEVRRQQRNFDREEHIQNSEYLKNIVIKFVTLTNGDEKQRLIPVINTILKLSSEENHLLQNACKSGWWSK